MFLPGFYEALEQLRTHALSHVLPFGPWSSEQVGFQGGVFPKCVSISFF